MLAFLNASPARRNRILLLTAALLILSYLLVQARAALFPFILGLILAYLLSPPVRRLEHLLPEKWSPERRRLLAVGQVYVVFLAVVFLLAVFVFPVIFRQGNNLIAGLPHIIEDAQTVFSNWIERYQSSVPLELQHRIEEMTADLATGVSDALEAAVLRSITVVSQTFSILLGVFTVPVWLFYILKDQPKAKEWLKGLLPLEHREVSSELISLVDKTLMSYLRGQLLLGVIVGLMTWVGLSLLSVPFAPVLAIIAGVTELIPILGPVLGAIPAVLVMLANEPTQAIWVVLLFVGVQAVENTLLVPRIQGHAVSLHPAVIMVLLVLASELAGFWGMLVAVPLAAVMRDIFVYLYRRYKAEEEIYTV